MIIGFVGKKRVGKSTACSMVPMGTVVSFREPLLEEVKMIFTSLLNMHAVKYKMTVDEVLEKKPGIIRQLLQWWGTDVRRAQDPDYWTDQWKAKVDETEGLILVDDLRFLNEANAITQRQGIIIRVVGEHADNTDTHASEKEMDMILEDYTIHNELGNKEVMQADLTQVLEIIKQQREGTTNTSLGYRDYAA